MLKIWLGSIVRFTSQIYCKFMALKYSFAKHCSEKVIDFTYCGKDLLPIKTLMHY